MTGSGIIINDTSRWIPRIESLYKGYRGDVIAMLIYILQKHRKH
jgi:hypothetical protein